MDKNNFRPQHSPLDQTEEQYSLDRNESDQIYQSFSPFDLSEILSRDAEMIERHYTESRGWNLWEREEHPRGKQYVRKRWSR